MTGPHSYTHTYSYAGKTVTVTAWAHPDVQIITHIVFLGTVQIGRLAEWVIAACPAGAVAIEGAPHWLAQAADGSDTPQFMAEYSRQSIRYLQGAFSLAAVNVVAESQAVPGTILALLDSPSGLHVTQLTLLQPLGFTMDAFGSNPSERIRTFKRRIRQNMSYQIPALLSDARLRYNHRQLLQVIDINSPQALAQYDSGLSYDGLPDLLRLHKRGLPIRIICGSKDMMFKPKEIQQSLTLHGINIPVTSLPGIPHSPLATKLGQKLLHAALEQ